MSTNHTKNYDLCQWVPSDKVIRTDFNEDNAKIDAALAAQSSALELMKAITDIAYTQKDKPVVVGSYAGTNTEQKNVNLGFRPSAVIAFTLQGNISTFESNYYFVRFAAATQNNSTGRGRVNVLNITENGFSAHNSDNGTFRYLLNDYDHVYMFFAFR